MPEVRKVFGRVVRLSYQTQTARLRQHREPDPRDERPSYHPKHRPTDLKEAEWLKVAPLFPDKVLNALNRKTPVRVLLNATFFRLENDLTLRELAKVAPDFPPWGSTHFFEQQLRKQGLWPKIVARTGRNYLMEALKKHMRLGKDVQLSHARVFGRDVRLSCGVNKHGHVGVRLPPALAAMVLAQASMIPDEELHEEGRETSPHVTVKYGFDECEMADAVDCVAGHGRPVVTLGKTAVFQNGDKDVLVVEASSVDLRLMHHALGECCARKDSYDEYVPHVTVAYLKPGLGERYAGDRSFEGLAFEADKAVYSPAEGDDQHVPFSDPKPPPLVLVALSHARKVFGKVRRFALGEETPAVADDAVARVARAAAEEAKATKGLVAKIAYNPFGGGDYFKQLQLKASPKTPRRTVVATPDGSVTVHDGRVDPVKVKQIHEEKVRIGDVHPVTQLLAQEAKEAVEAEEALKASRAATPLGPKPPPQRPSYFDQLRDKALAKRQAVTQ